MFLIKKIIIVAVLFLGIYLLLRVVPKTKLEDRDIFIISLVFVVAYLLFDKFVLSKGEHMGNMPTESTSTPAMPPAMPPTAQAPQAPQAAQATQAAPAMPSATQPTAAMPSATQPSPPTAQPAPPTAPPAPAPKVPEIEECSTCKIDIKNNQSVEKTSNDEQNMAYLYSPMRKYPSTGSRIEDGILTSEMSYTDYNTLPVGANVDTKLDDFSYTFLPPDKWYPIPPHPPICVAEKQCPVCPVTTTGTTTNLKEWSEASRVTPGDQINSNYINGKINSGK